MLQVHRAHRQGNDRCEVGNWIPPVAGKGWFPFFRFYGPDKLLFDKTWKQPGEIELAQ